MSSFFMRYAGANYFNFKPFNFKPFNLSTFQPSYPSA